MSEHKIICAGFGGQGVMSMGRLLAYTGMIHGLEVSWLPSYGPEMRGGTANCHVIISAHPVASPVIAHDATAALVMNLPSLRKFEVELVAGGLLVVNTSLIAAKTERTDVQVVDAPANQIANELGNLKIANMVMLGAFLAATQLFTVDQMTEALGKVFGPKKSETLPLNREALECGFALGAVQPVGR